VIASAAVGALLQNRLADALHTQAVHYGAKLPAPVRDHFVASFSGAAKSGFEVGRGQTGGSLHLPANVPASVVAEVQRVAAAVFTHGFSDAARPTLVLPIALIVLAAVGCLAVQDSKAGAAGWETGEQGNLAEAMGAAS